MSGFATKPVLAEAQRLLGWYASDESNPPDEDTALVLTHMELRPIVRDGEYVAYEISTTSSEISGPVGEKTNHHYDTEVLADDGTLLSHVADGVEQVPKWEVKFMRFLSTYSVIRGDEEFCACRREADAEWIAETLNERDRKERRAWQR